MDQVAALRTFMVLVETGSVTRSSATLGIPKSTVSKQLADLERHLGARLFQRSTRAMKLTAEGAAYYERVGPLVLGLSDADQSIRDESASPAGQVRIDINSTMANEVLIPALPDFRARYPHIRLVIGVSDRPVNLIEEGVDCVVRLGPLPDSALVGRTLYTDPVVTCASPGYLKRRGRPASPDDLAANHDCIGYISSRSGDRWPLKFSKNGKTVEISDTGLTTDDSLSYGRMLVAGLGVGQVFRSTVVRHLEEGRLVAVLEDWTSSSAPISILYPSSRMQSTRVRAFIEWFAAELSEPRKMDGA